jgi:hypothetical protein
MKEETVSAATLPPVSDPFADNTEDGGETYITVDATGDEPTVQITPDDPQVRLTPEEQKIRTAEFPYGRKADGTPRKKSGPPAGSGPTGGTRTIPRVSAAKPRKTQARKQTTGTDYRPGIQGLMQIPAAALGAMGMRDKAFALDGAAIAMHTPQIAEALNDLAQDNLAVAAALDKILSVGPYGAILGAVLPLVAQIAANHRALPDQITQGMGAMPVEQFEQFVIGQSGLQPPA